MKKIGLLFLFVLMLQMRAYSVDFSAKATYYYNEETKSCDDAAQYYSQCYSEAKQEDDDGVEDDEANCSYERDSQSCWRIYYVNPYEICGIDLCSLFDSTIVEARVSYFGFFSKRLRQIYNNGGANYTVSAMVPICGGFNVWGAIDYFSKRGKIASIDSSTRITIAPLTLGLKYVYSFYPCLDLYGGIGMRYFFVRVKNSNSTFLSRHINRSGLGGVAEIGAIYRLTDCWLVEVFGNASAKRLRGKANSSVNVESDRTQIGGWSIGAGIGYRF